MKAGLQSWHRIGNWTPMPQAEQLKECGNSKLSPTAVISSLTRHQCSSWASRKRLLVVCDSSCGTIAAAGSYDAFAEPEGGSEHLTIKETFSFRRRTSRVERTLKSTDNRFFPIMGIVLYLLSQQSVTLY